MSHLQKLVNQLKQSTQSLSDWMLEAVSRIFSPKDDNYPDTGVQPFEDDIPEINHQR